MARFGNIRRRSKEGSTEKHPLQLRNTSLPKPLYPKTIETIDVVWEDAVEEKDQGNEHTNTAVCIATQHPRLRQDKLRHKQTIRFALSTDFYEDIFCPQGPMDR